MRKKAFEKLHDLKEIFDIKMQNRREQSYFTWIVADKIGMSFIFLTIQLLVFTSKLSPLPVLQV